MVIFKNYSSGLLKLLCVCMLIILCALPPCKVYYRYVTFLSNVSVKGFISEQFGFTKGQFPYLIMHGAMRNNGFDRLLKVRKHWKC